MSKHKLKKWLRSPCHRVSERLIKLFKAYGI